MAFLCGKGEIITALLLLSALVLSSSVPTVASVQAAEFDISVQPTVQYVAPGTSTQYTILIASKGGFNSPIELFARNVPNGVKSSFSATTVTPPADGVAYSILMVSSSLLAQTGTFSMLVVASSGTLSRSISVGLTITTTSQIAIAISPSARTVGPGKSTDYEVTVRSVAGFSSDVNLDSEGLPGTTFRFNPAVVKPTPGSPAKSTLTITADKNANAGTYTFVVRASGARPDVRQYSSAVLIVSGVSDFLLAVSPSTQGVNLGEATSFSLTVSSLGGFSSDVTLNLPMPPPGVGFSIDHFVVSPTPSSSATATLKVTTTVEAKPGTYAIVIVGSSGETVRSLAVTVIIYPAASNLAISSPPTSAKLGYTMTVTGVISPKIARVGVKLTYTKPDGTTVDRTVVTAEDGSFSDSYSPDALGLWQVFASWQGDETHTGAKSTMATFEVVEPSFLDLYGMTLAGVLVVVVALAGAVFYFRSRRGRAPSVAPVTPPLGEVPRAAPLTRPGSKEAPPLILPRKYCFNCGEVISAEATFCDKCRAPQPEKIEKKHEAPSLIIQRKYCFNCGEVISAQAAFCDKCRAPQP